MVQQQLKNTYCTTHSCTSSAQIRRRMASKIGQLQRVGVEHLLLTFASLTMAHLLQGCGGNTGNGEFIIGANSSFLDVLPTPSPTSSPTSPPTFVVSPTPSPNSQPTLPCCTCTCGGSGFAGCGGGYAGCEACRAMQGKSYDECSAIVGCECKYYDVTRFPKYNCACCQFPNLVPPQAECPADLPAYR